MLNLDHSQRLQEIQEDLVTVNMLEEAVRKRRAVIFKATGSPIVVGHGMLVKVNTNVGISSLMSLDAELSKLRTICGVGFAPDTMMDHTVVKLPKKQFYSHLIDHFSGPVGTLPHYLAYNPENGIDMLELLDIATEQAESGVSFMTLHPTSTRELYDLACATRIVPTTSRGGGLLLQDMIMHDRKVNVMEKVFPDLLSILLKHKMVVSIGSTFRPANIGEALDEVHRREIALQGDYIGAARDAGVPVQLEGIGHIKLSDLAEYFDLIADFAVPMMPLGPLPTDAAIGQDHIANAIGATLAAWTGGAHIVNSITREEHTGGVPTEESIMEGLRAARIAAHAVNISRFPQLAQVDQQVADLRAKNYTCTVDGGLFTRSAAIQYSLGCTRCSQECPLLVTKITRRDSK